MNNREAFEAWFIETYTPDNMNRDEQGDYISTTARLIWQAWQAALASQAQQPSEALKEMEARKDAAYLERNQVVAALAKCFPSGIAKTAIEGWSEDWHGCVYIDLPTGQASWHFHDSQAYLFADLPAYTGKWDGHTTEEKYRRVSMLAAQAQQSQWISVEEYEPIDGELVYVFHKTVREVAIAVCETSKHYSRFTSYKFGSEPIAYYTHVSRICAPLPPAPDGDKP